MFSSATNKTLPEEKTNRKALSLLVGAGAGLHGEHTAKFACVDEVTRCSGRDIK